MRRFISIVPKAVREQPMEIAGGWEKVGVGMFQAEGMGNARTERQGQPGIFSEQQGDQCG